MTVESDSKEGGKQAISAWLSQWQALLDEGAALDAQHPGVPHGGASASGKCCVMVSPHPDDECIVGALPLRLLRQGGWRVVNLAVTHGSNPQRQLARPAELEKACQVLGFENRLLAPRGLVRVSEASRSQEPGHWANCVEVVAQQIRALQPDLLLCPHPQDAQAAHRGTYCLLMDVLAGMPAHYSPLVAMTEYWSTMAAPNLMLQVDVPELAVLLSALMQHAGEITRNPYHLSLPAWMMDSVRRGAELVGKPGDVAPRFSFATLYRVMRWHPGDHTGGGLQPAWEGGRFAPCGDRLAFLQG